LPETYWPLDRPASEHAVAESICAFTVLSVTECGQSLVAELHARVVVAPAAPVSETIRTSFSRSQCRFMGSTSLTVFSSNRAASGGSTHTLI
jgi:hypothetical protein